MSIGINEIQGTWSNFNKNNPNWNTSMSLSSSGQKGVTGLQSGSGPLNNAANAMSANANIPGINAVELPDWLKGGPDANMGELLGSYAGTESSFDPSGQVAIRNSAMGYNGMGGTRAAKKAAAGYADRATQQGGSALGAGVVYAQAMMPIFAQNAALKGDAAD